MKLTVAHLISIFLAFAKTHVFSTTYMILSLQFSTRDVLFLSACLH